MAEPRAWIGDVPVYCSFDELVDTNTLVPNPRNPNEHPPEQIKLLAGIIDLPALYQIIAEILCGGVFYVSAALLFNVAVKRKTVIEDILRAFLKKR